MRTLSLSKPQLWVFVPFMLGIIFLTSPQKLLPSFLNISGINSNSYHPTPSSSSNALLLEPKKKVKKQGLQVLDLAFNVPSLTNMCRDGQYRTLPDIVITETANDDFKDNSGMGTGENAQLRIKTTNGVKAMGFEMVENSPVTVTITGAGITDNGTANTNVILYNSGNDYYYVDLDINIGAASQTVANSITISGIQIRALSGSYGVQNFTWFERDSPTDLDNFVGLDNMGETTFATVSAQAEVADITFTGGTTLSYCTGSNVDKDAAANQFTVTAAATDGTIKWYSDVSLTTQVAQGNTVGICWNNGDCDGTENPANTNVTDDKIEFPDARGAGIYTYYVVREVNGCRGGVNSVSVTIQADPSVTVLQTAGSASFCEGGTAQFTAVGDGTNNYVWQVKVGAGSFANATAAQGAASGTNNSVFTTNAALTANSYEVRAIASITTTGGDCSTNSTAVPFTINALPTVTLATSPPGSTSITVGDQITLDGSQSNAGNFSGAGVKQTGAATYVFDSQGLTPGNYAVNYSYTNVNGCTGNAAPLNIVVNAVSPLLQLNGTTTGVPINICVEDGAIAAQINTVKLAADSPADPCGNTLSTTYSVTSSVAGLITSLNTTTGTFTINPNVLNAITTTQVVDIDVRPIYSCLGLNSPNYGTTFGTLQKYAITFYPSLDLTITGFNATYCVNENTNIKLTLKDRANEISVNDANVQFRINGTLVPNSDPRLDNATQRFNPSVLGVGTHQISFDYVNVCSGTSPQINLVVVSPPTIDFDDIDGPGNNITYCNESNNTLQFNPLVNGVTPTGTIAQSGFFTLDDGVNAALVLPKAQHFVDLSILTSNTTYQVTYTYELGACTVVTPAKNLVITDKPTLALEGITNNASYCTNVANITLVGKVTPPGGGAAATVALGTASDFVRLRYVATGVTTTLADDQLRLSTLTPGAYEVTFFHTETGNYKCSSNTTLNITINKPDEASLNGITNGESFCIDKGNVTLIPLVNNQTPGDLTKGVYRIWQPSSGLDSTFIATATSFNTQTLRGVGTYNINFTYEDPNACKDTSATTTFSIVTVPQNVRVTTVKDFNQRSLQYTSSASGAISYNWDFKDGTSSADQNPLRQLSSESNTAVNNYLIRIQNAANCFVTYDKSFVVNFDFSGQCQGSPTQFSDLSSSSTDAFGSWLWDFGDGTTSTLQNPAHTYNAAQSYTVSLTVTTADGIASYTLRKRVDIFPGIIVTPATPYLQDFSGGTSGWIAQGTVDSLGVSLDRKSWQLKVPNGFNVPGDKGNSWITDNTGSPSATADAKYNANEQSYVESPCFDITALNRPMVSFSYFSDTDAGSDGVVLLYSVDDGKNWFRLGAENQGIDWYNTKPILGKPGDAYTNDNADNQGWSGNTQSTATTKVWKVARFGLDDVLARLAGQTTKLVRFRVAFGSNTDNTPNVQFDGFAFDDFQVNNRNRLVLTEYFINQSRQDAANLDAAANTFATTKAEMINIHYHTDFPGPDDINTTSEKDVSARSFHYGIREVPRIVVDGQTRDSIPVLTNGDPNNWAETVFSTQALIAAPFTIAVGNPIASGGTLTVNATVNAIQAVNSQTVMHVVVIDSTVTLGGATFYNAVRKMLPDAAGTFRTQAWAMGDSQNLSFTWDYGSVGLDPARFRIVVFVADYQTNAIYQAEVSNVTVNRNGGSNGGNGNQVTGIVDDLKGDNVKVFPNPGRRYLNISLQNNGLSEDAKWEIVSINGQLMKQGVWNRGYKQIKLDIADLANGLYLIKVYNDKTTFQRRFEKH